MGDISKLVSSKILQRSGRLINWRQVKLLCQPLISRRVWRWLAFDILHHDHFWAGSKAKNPKKKSWMTISQFCNLRISQQKQTTETTANWHLRLRFSAAFVQKIRVCREKNPKVVWQTLCQMDFGQLHFPFLLSLICPINCHEIGADIAMCHMCPYIRVCPHRCIYCIYFIFIYLFDWRPEWRNVRSQFTGWNN